MSREGLVSIARSVDEVKQVITTLTEEECAPAEWLHRLDRGTARTPWRDSCAIDGDPQVAATFLDALNIV